MPGKAGLKQILLCNSASLATTPVNPCAMGIKKNTALLINDFRNEKDWRGRSQRNMQNHKVEGESMQPTMFMLNQTLNWLNGNCDAQVITTKQTSSSGSEDVFKYVGNNIMGLNFEHVIAHDKRTMKWILERAIEWAASKSLIDSADSENFVSVIGLTDTDIEGKNWEYYRSPFFLAAEAPAATALVTQFDRIERKFTIKGKSSGKNEYNMDIIDYISFSFELTGRNAQIANFITLMSKDASPSVLVKEQNNSTFYDAFDFAAGVLTYTGDLDINDEKRELKIKFEADVPLFDIAFEFGATKGGDAADTTGLKGGTMKVGY